jgi:fluoroacetyl-CoA thioesterase
MKKKTLRPGLVRELRYRVAAPQGRGPFDSRSVPAHAAPVRDPMLGLVPWACMETMRHHLDAGEHSVGLDTLILQDAVAAAGLVARVEVIVEKVEGRRVCFRVKAYDGVRPIGEGTHERFVIDRERHHGPARPRPRRPGAHGAGARKASKFVGTRAVSR